VIDGHIIGSQQRLGRCGRPYPGLSFTRVDVPVAEAFAEVILVLRIGQWEHRLPSRGERSEAFTGRAWTIGRFGTRGREGEEPDRDGDQAERPLGRQPTCL
jgi:hypothetical protein